MQSIVKNSSVNVPDMNKYIDLKLGKVMANLEFIVSIEK